MKKLIFLISPILFMMSLFFPKRKTLWVYGAWFGERYDDNSKDLFEFANTVKNNKIEHYWIYKNPSLKEIIEKKGYNCANAYSLKGIIIQLRAKVFITCINSSDFIPFLVTPRNYFVQLWHGSPIKYLGYDSRKTSIKKIMDYIRFKLLDNYSMVVSPSQLFDKTYQSAICANNNKRFFRGGYPRNENLIIDYKTRKQVKDFFKIGRDEILIAYLPTHRNEGKSQSPFKSILKEIIKRKQKRLKNQKPG